MPDSVVPVPPLAVPEGLSPLVLNEASHLREHWQALEQELHRSQQQAGSLEAAVQLLEAMPGGGGSRAKCCSMSRAAAALLGRDAKSLQGVHLHQLLHNQSGLRQWIARATGSLASFGHVRGGAVEAPARLTRWLQVRARPCSCRPGQLWLLDDAEAPPAAPAGTLAGCARRGHRPAQPVHAADAAAVLVRRCPPSRRARAAVAGCDHFTALNATAGRAGDEVLRQVAWLLQREQGAHGLAARWGRTPLLWLHAADTEAAVQTLAWRLCAAVQEWAPTMPASVLCWG
jgi:hypothetical protein